MARAARLLELLIRLRTTPRVTAQELADHFEVSRRTMLRDLRTLSDVGVPLIAAPGPGGGYRLARDQRLAPLALTMDEALGVLLSYEAFLRDAPSPFAVENLSAVTKLRATLPLDIAREVERVRRHVAVIARPRGAPAPLLGALLQASLDGVHLRVVYDSRSGVSERVIFPFGLFLADERWYCACHDDTRGRDISLRADRVVSLARVEGRDRPPLDARDRVADRCVPPHRLGACHRDYLHRADPPQRASRPVCRRMGGPLGPQTCRPGVTERDTRGKVQASFRLKQGDDHDSSGQKVATSTGGAPFVPSNTVKDPRRGTSAPQNRPKYRFQQGNRPFVPAP